MTNACALMNTSHSVISKQTIPAQIEVGKHKGHDWSYNTQVLISNKQYHSF